MRARALFAGLWLAATVQSLPAEASWLLAGDATAVLNLEPTEADLRLHTGFEADLGPVTGRLLGGLRLTDRTTATDLSEAWLNLGLADWGAVKAGWWPETAGPGLFHSAVAVAARGPDTEPLATAGSPTARSVGKVEGRLTAGEWTLTAAFVPQPPAVELPDAASVWVPRRAIPTSVDVGGSPMVLGALGFTGTKEDLGPAARASVAWAALWGTWTAGWYQGPDSQAVYPARFRPFLPNDLTLRPVRRRVDRGWTTVEAPVGPVSLWLDAGATRGRAVTVAGWQGTDPQDGTYILGKVAETSAGEATAGAAWSVQLGPGGALRLWTEGTAYRDLDQPDRTAPDFSEGAEAGAHWDWPREAGSLDLSAGVPWSADCGWLWAKVSWAGIEGQTLWVAAPWFWGPPDSLWGQFSDRRVVEAGTSWRL